MKPAAPDYRLGQVVASVLSQSSPGVIQEIDNAFDKVEVSLLECKECRGEQMAKAPLSGESLTTIAV